MTREKNIEIKNIFSKNKALHTKNMNNFYHFEEETKSLEERLDITREQQLSTLKKTMTELKDYITKNLGYDYWNDFSNFVSDEYANLIAAFANPNNTPKDLFKIYDGFFNSIENKTDTYFKPAKTIAKEQSSKDLTDFAKNIRKTSRDRSDLDAENANRGFSGSKKDAKNTYKNNVDSFDFEIETFNNFTAYLKEIDSKHDYYKQLYKNDPASLKAIDTMISDQKKIISDYIAIDPKNMDIAKKSVNNLYKSVKSMSDFFAKPEVNVEMELDSLISEMTGSNAKSGLIIAPKYISATKHLCSYDDKYSVNARDNSIRTIRTTLLKQKASFDNRYGKNSNITKLLTNNIKDIESKIDEYIKENKNSAKSHKEYCDGLNDLMSEIVGLVKLNSNTIDDVEQNGVFKVEYSGFYNLHNEISSLDQNNPDAISRTILSLYDKDNKTNNFEKLDSILDSISDPKVKSKVEKHFDLIKGKLKEIVDVKTNSSVSDYDLKFLKVEMEKANDILVEASNQFNFDRPNLNNQKNDLMKDIDADIKGQQKNRENHNNTKEVNASRDTLINQLKNNNFYDIAIDLLKNLENPLDSVVDPVFADIAAFLAKQSGIAPEDRDPDLYNELIDLLERARQVELDNDFEHSKFKACQDEDENNPYKNIEDTVKAYGAAQEVTKQLPQEQQDLIEEQDNDLRSRPEVAKARQKAEEAKLKGRIKDVKKFKKNSENIAGAAVSAMFTPMGMLFIAPLGLAAVSSLIVGKMTSEVVTKVTKKDLKELEDNKEAYFEDKKQIKKQDNAQNLAVEIMNSVLKSAGMDEIDLCENFETTKDFFFKNVEDPEKAFNAAKDNLIKNTATSRKERKAAKAIETLDQEGIKKVNTKMQKIGNFLKKKLGLETENESEAGPTV